MTVNSIQEAWDEANKIITTDYMPDTVRSHNAGYPIYFTTADSMNEWISDLGNRLEVNLHTGKTVNIWIDDRHPLEKSGFKKNTLGIWVLA